MKLPITDKCCCCLSLRTGVLVFGSINAVLASIALILTIAYLEGMEKTRTALELLAKYNETHSTEVDITQLNSDVYEVAIVFFGLRLMLSVILIVGANKRDVVFLNIYLVYQLIQMSLICLWVLVEIFGSPSGYLLFRLLDLAFQTYIYIVIKSLIIEVQTTQIPEYDENNMYALKNTEVN